MFEGLIEFIEATVFGLLNQITAQEEDGLRQVRQIVAKYGIKHFYDTGRGGHGHAAADR